MVTTAFRKRIPTRYHIGWLNTMLWGGTLALALEHVAHEEIVAYPPFLSATSSAANTASMLYETATVGTAILVVCVAAWAGMVLVYNRLALRSAETAKTAQTS
jgi:hypothetical protein